MTDDIRQWSWWAGEGEEPEGFKLQGVTRESVIAAAHDEFGLDAVFTIVEATQDGPFVTDIFDDHNVEDVIDRFVEANGDRFCPDDGFDGHIDQAAFAAALNAACKSYFADHGGDIIVWAFTAQRNKEVIRPTAAPA
jgi:hypothetical protein